MPRERFRLRVTTNRAAAWRDLRGEPEDGFNSGGADTSIGFDIIGRRGEVVQWRRQANCRAASIWRECVHGTLNRDPEDTARISAQPTVSAVSGGQRVSAR